MTVKEFLLKRYPTNNYMDCPIPKHHWETMQQYADAYHKDKMKILINNLKSNTMKEPQSKVLFRLPTKILNTVKFMAAKNHRSVNSELINIVEKSLKTKSND